MVPLKFSLLTVFLLVILANNINCKDEEKKEKVDEDKTVDEETVEQSDNNNEPKINETDYDEIGERFLSLLSENLKFKILKNKAANEGLLDQEKFKREPLTKQELDEVQSALVQAMQPLFGQFVKDLDIDDIKQGDDKEPALELDPPKVDIKKKPKEEPKKQSDKKPTDEKKTDESVKKDDKEKMKKEKPTKEDAKKETQKDKMKKDSEKGKKKTEKTKEEKKDKKQKEEL
uniref:Uncharacterized protein n=1 Tax=Pristhesancus plagipennis TaxID=1955184 RepID=A0A2K8JLX2_PRIPG|nr:secreted hypothetical protein [Pristhesancus plagipennis]